MIEITPTENQISEARKTSGQLMSLQGSITRGAGSPAGALGEIIVRDYFGYIHTPNPHYDLYTPEGVTIDVKTKRCTSAPFHTTNVVSRHTAPSNDATNIFLCVF